MRDLFSKQSETHGCALPAGAPQVSSRMSLSTMEQTEIVVPEEVFEAAAESIGAYFEPISKIDRETIARDFLDLSRPVKRAAIIERYARLERAKLLEVGSGFGTNLAVWLKRFQVDAYGVEPGGEGFN